MEYKPVFSGEIKFSILTKLLPTKGNIVYEYNPLRNYRLSQNMYEYLNQMYSKEELQSKFNITMNSDSTDWIGVPATETDPILHEKGELVDFNTSELKVDINHPIQMIPLYSYDGSVNLIINDGINIPRLINSRFSATGRNTYEIVDRKGNNDTNIYDLGDLFDIDTSLYKRVTTIPKIEFKGLITGGNLKIGNYHFYFKFSDADGNETDFVGESGLVSVFIGFNSYLSVHTGLRNENSHKQVQFLLSNIDSSYQQVYVYYSRYTAEGSENSVTEYAKIDKPFLVNNANICNITISGFEEIEQLTVSDINLFYNTVDAVGTSAVCQNMLFLANVHKPDIPYTELSDLSLRFLPYLHEELYEAYVNENYTFNTTSVGYIDPKYIYNKTGYWTEEIYRLGIVYIMPNGTLSPVFNIRGAYKIPNYNKNKYTINGVEKNNFYSDKPVFKSDNSSERDYIQYDESTYYIINTNGNAQRENVKGVVSFESDKDNNIIYGIDIRVDNDTIVELKKYVKGYFFVRQPRIPTILAQGITVGIDNESRTPTIPTAESFLTEVNYDNTHVTTEDVNDVNYISEGFLLRYSFEYEEQENSFWKDFGKVMLTATVIVAAAAATVFTMGAGAVIVGIVAGAALASTALVVAVKEGYDEIANEVRQKKGRPKKKLDGRNTEPVSGYDIIESEESRKLISDFNARVIIKDPSKNKVQGIFCPDYELNQPFYNQIFTGNKHLIKSTKAQGINELNEFSSNYFTNIERHFYIPSYYDRNTQKQGYFNIVGVADGVKAACVDGLIFRSKAGEAEEAFRYEQVGIKFKDETMDINTHKKEEKVDKVSFKKINSDIIRGLYGAYLAFNNNSNLFSPAETVNIYIPEYQISNMGVYYDVRMQDNSSYNAISDRFDINELPQTMSLTGEVNYSKQYTLFRGDCYLCLFTHRVIRNFNDPSAPYNDDIVDANSWKDNYDPDNSESYANINLGDVNAVPLGMWVTFRVRSSNNLNVRTLDGSNVSETAMSGHEKGFYPYYPMSVDGSYKMSDSQVYNKGFAKSLSERWNVPTPDVPHIKNWFGTRIMYSDIHINDAYKNGFRVFQGTNYRDYTREYGEITKLIPLESNLLVIFEHGIGLATVNERAVAAQGAGGNVYINSSNVLPENLFIISDMFGSLWAESVLKVPGKTGSSALWVYGVDTVAKKIWRTNGLTLECISDMRVQEFLNNNITLGERELTPKIGIRNVKTVYNAFKRDVLFTFYDNTYGFEEKVWNLCWNEILEKFITFYSWVPSYMENINNIPFSFNRDTSKWIAKLGTSHTKSSIADGVTLSNVLTLNKTVTEGRYEQAVNNFIFNYSYIDNYNNEVTEVYEVADESKSGFIGVLSLSNRTLPNKSLFYLIEFSLERDNYLNYEKFEVVPIKVKNPRTNLVEDGITLPNNAKFAGYKVYIYALKFKTESGSGTEVSNIEKVYYKDDNEILEVLHEDSASDQFVYIKTNKYRVESLLTELYYRNSAGNSYADYDVHKIGPEYLSHSKQVDLWCRDEVILDKIISKAGTDLHSIKIGNSVCTTLNNKYYIHKGSDGSEYILSDLTGEAVKSSDNPNATLPPYVDLNAMDNTPEEYNDYLREELGNGKIRLWSNNWNKPEMQATPAGTPYPCTTLEEIKSLIKYRTVNNKLVPYVHGIPLQYHWVLPESGLLQDNTVYYDLPIFKDITGKRKMLPRDLLLNPDKLVTLLNIRANIKLLDEVNQNSISDVYYNSKASFNAGTSLIDAGYYESVVAITPEWNLLFLGSDFWKHGQAGIIDIADDIYPTYWYGKQHPFEFECVVVNDPGIHKIFTNMELVANKAKPESFHYEIIGDVYDFAKDKKNMYFRQEAMKALWLYNGADICYNRNFLKIQPEQLVKSADFPHKYYTRLDTINEVEDYYIGFSSVTHDYKHLSGSEIVYYPNRQEYRVWTHSRAVDLDTLPLDNARSVIAANCLYLEDRWRISINPIVVCYKNENRWSTPNKPRLPVMNSPIPERAYENIAKFGLVELPPTLLDLGYNASIDIDKHNWLDDNSTYGTSFGEAQNRKETDIRGKFVKVRIRYSGEELAIIDFLNTIYRISYA